MSGLNKKTTAALLLLVSIWGISWPIYKVSAAYAPPLLFGGMRALFGGCLVVLVMLRFRSELKWRQHWRKYCISALFNTVLFFGLHTLGFNYLPGGLLSVLVYFQPVLLGVFAWIWLGERMTVLNVFGLFLGFIGISIVSVDGLTSHLSGIGVLLGLLTAFFWAIGVIYVKKVSEEVNAFWMVAMQFTIGGAVLLLLGSLTESWSAIEWNGMFLFGVGFGSTVGIPVAYIIYYKLLQAGVASKVGVFTFLVPIISVFVSTIVVGETITFKLIAGLVLVVLSIYFVNYRKKQPAILTVTY
ncbi:DMT family transporter [Sporosarcina sp. GW1-11]|uniref:DMT family transporter n=1 Tax=Sporosarcina sp. GW1-11 TaxID=2899126 RepID=UPI00294D6BF6|nr:DMT family transporter [Sporosarcina sp. GW1-11]MDV6378685.1 DMT family transporter [Sporosarcina sp. GW1-11]